MLATETVKRVLNAALRNGGDLAELYLENTEQLQLGLDDQKLENAQQGSDVGGGVRVFYGSTAAYAYTDDLSEAALIEAAQTAAAAARSTNAPRALVDLTKRTSPLQFTVARPYDGMKTVDKAAILRQMDEAARGYSSLITGVQASYAQTSRRVWIYNSEGLWAEDDREMLEFRVGVTAKKGELLHRMSTGLGGQIGLELLDDRDPVAVTIDAAESAVRMLDARSAPAGEMDVVICNGWGGVLFHEACGHCLEADFITNGSSAYAGLVGERVGPSFLTAVDDGTIPGRRGSIRFDDEGTPSRHTVFG
ncbi:MAG: TldD/PmbA family protein [Caldilineaceae bacterium]